MWMWCKCPKGRPTSHSSPTFVMCSNNEAEFFGGVVDFSPPFFNSPDSDHSYPCLAAEFKHRNSGNFHSATLCVYSSSIVFVREKKNDVEYRTRLQKKMMCYVCKTSERTKARFRIFHNTICVKHVYAWNMHTYVHSRTIIHTHHALTRIHTLCAQAHAYAHHAIHATL